MCMRRKWGGLSVEEVAEPRGHTPRDTIVVSSASDRWDGRLGECPFMRKVPVAESLRIIGRGTANWFAERPLVVSFEVTDGCTCYCKHCDHGGPKDDSRNLKPADYRRYMDALKPCVVQISGGEPLMRKDVAEIVRNIKLRFGAALHHPGFQLVRDDRGAVSGTHRGGHRPVLRQPRFPRRAVTTSSAAIPACTTTSATSSRNWRSSATTTSC